MLMPRVVTLHRFTPSFKRVPASFHFDRFRVETIASQADSPFFFSAFCPRSPLCPLPDASRLSLSSCRIIELSVRRSGVALNTLPDLPFSALCSFSLPHSLFPSYRITLFLRVVNSPMISALCVPRCLPVEVLVGVDLSWSRTELKTFTRG